MGLFAVVALVAQSVRPRVWIDALGKVRASSGRMRCRQAVRNRFESTQVNAVGVLCGCVDGWIEHALSHNDSALMIGILATVLLQSSGTTTGVVVSLVESQTIEVERAIYM